MSQFKKYFRDNVHGDIEIHDKVIFDLINTEFFQRLRRIEQLGGAKYVFLGANHTRFSHCIGVYHVVTKFLQNLDIYNHYSKYEKDVLMISGLLHDVGHGPFSHSFEWLIYESETPKHEQYSSKIILEDKQISNILKKYKIDPQDVCNAIEGKSKRLSPIISSQVDADRFDYIIRDGLLVGVNYAKSDVDWIIRNTIFIDDQMVFKSKATSSLESYLLGRYHMYLQVYQHNTSLEFDETLRAWFERVNDLWNENYNFKNPEMCEMFFEIIKKETIPLNKYKELDDILMLQYFKECLKEKDKILAKLSYMLINRQFLKIVKDINAEKFNEMKNKISENDGRKYFARIQSNIPINLYKAKNSDEEIKILAKNNLIVNLNEISLLITKNNFVTNNNNLYLFAKEYI